MASHESLIFETLQRLEASAASQLEEVRKQTRLLEEQYPEAAARLAKNKEEAKKKVPPPKKKPEAIPA